METSETLRDMFEDQARWRREKAVECPDDSRNKIAAEIFDKLAATSADVSENVLRASGELFENFPDSEVWGEMLRRVGFWYFPEPETAERFLLDFIANRTSGELGSRGA
jgi:hypothetical protein